MAIYLFIVILLISSVFAKPSVNAPRHANQKRQATMRTTSPIQPGCMYEGRYYSVGATITDHGTYGIACGELGIHAWDSNFVLDPDQSTPPPTTTIPPKHQHQAGCMYEGRYYSVGETIADHGTKGIACGELGIHAWDINFVLDPDQTTPPPSTTIPPKEPHQAGCMYEGRYYSVGETIADHGTKGIACGELGIHAWDINFVLDPDQTTPPPTTTIPPKEPHQAGCMYEGRYYSVGATITDHGTNGIACGESGIHAWDSNFVLDPDQSTPPPTTTIPPKEPHQAGCMYEGRYYSVGETITDHGTKGIACGELGIHAWDINFRLFPSK